MLAACVSGGSGVAGLGVDQTAITGSVPPPAPAEAAGRPTDAAVIGAAVASASPADVEKGPVTWSNPASGASGEIDSVSEFKDGAALCRRFTTLKRSYDGVALFRGEACEDAGGMWRMRSLGAL